MGNICTKCCGQESHEADVSYLDVDFDHVLDIISLLKLEVKSSAISARI